MTTIKFSHKYDKMPEDVSDTYLIEVLTANKKDLHSAFIDHDTAYGLNNYELPNGGLLILILKSYIRCAVGEVEEVWTTVRRQTPEKEAYYRNLRGTKVQIQIEEP